MIEKSKKKIAYVGMSGGVDSSVAAALLKKQGFDVVGVFMKPWQPYEDEDTCLWKQDREDAMRSATTLGIPLLTWDFSKEYKKSVTDYMIREYKVGRTPNPDVMCNKEIKFGLFLKKALKEGAGFIATGHYVKIRNNKEKRINKSKITNNKSQINLKTTNSKLQTTKYSLFTARDGNKDQSYFLWTLTQAQLKHCLFPIGDLTKPEVRKMAKKFKLPNAEKKDSQGVCFIGPLDMKEFLIKNIKPKSGQIIHEDGRILGKHDGVYYYTIGQRHGLDIKDGGGPYYIVAKDLKKNIIVVGNDKVASSSTARIGDLNWITSIKLPEVFDVRVRYRAPLQKAKLFKNGNLEFSKPERAVTSGQSAVFYKRGQLVGGGIIL